MKNYLVFSMAALLVGASCNTKQEKAAEGFTGAPGEVKLVTLDPGHFHAALVQSILNNLTEKNILDKLTGDRAQGSGLCCGRSG